MTDTALVSSAGTAAATRGSASSLARLSENLDNFLSILTTQLQHQDPLSPMDTHEFTQQLVQFSSVEQLVRQNANLESLLALQKSNQAVAAVSYIDRIVEADGNANMLAGGSATFTYVLPAGSAAASIQIFTENGELVFQDDVETGAGIHDYVRDGTTSRGKNAPDGVYTFHVSAVNEKGQPVEVQHRILGTVTAVTFENGETTLGIGDVGVPLTAVRGVHASNAAPANTTEG